MKASEFKLRLLSGVNGLIDTYYGSGSLIDNTINGTLKLIVKQKSYLVDDALEYFTDKDGCIDEHTVIDEYKKVFGDKKFTLDLRDFINNDFLKNMLPNKALSLDFEDIIRMIKY